MSAKLISALQEPSVYPHPTSTIQVLETHISWVVLTGDYVYKIKKPVDFGFLDFTSLAKRKQYCEAELTLNARSAPDLYLELVTITGSPDKPKLAGSGSAIEYAVKMKQFESGKLFSELSSAGQLDFEHINVLAEQIAEFHQCVDTASIDSLYGQPSQLFEPMQQNFDLIRQFIVEPEQRAQLEQLEAWTQSSFERLTPVLVHRKASGYIRECHGDMHLGNITLLRNRATLFDCIEFNANLRWIDVISDVAFLVMDFEDHELPHFANRFLNNYLELTGDYSGLKLLNFYKCYRALVRAKVALLTLNSGGQNEAQKGVLMRQYQRYIDLAESYTGLTDRVVMTMHGLSGSGKSTVSTRLVDLLGLIRIRSDIERKRLFGLSAKQRSQVTDKLYSDAATHKTYERLCELGAEVLDSGFSVIVDATNLKRWQRQAIQVFANERAVPVCIADCQAPMPLIEAWIQKRKAENQDASEADLAIVARQQEIQEPLSEEERIHTFVIHGDILAQTDKLVRKIKKTLA